MSTFSVRNRIFIFLGIACAFPMTVFAGPISLTVGMPMKAGMDTFEITPPGGEGGTIVLTLNGNESDVQKADLLDAALTNKGIAFNRQKNTAKFTFPNTVTAVGVDDRTKEHIVLETAGMVPGLSELGFFGTLNGFDSSGFASTFEATIGLTVLTDGGPESILSSASVNFSQLAAPTVDALLQAIFVDLLADLPQFLQADLLLDLPHQVVAFAYPGNTVDVFADSFTSDVTTNASVRLSEVPEPSTILLLGAGLAWLLMSAWTWRATVG
jgi:PEP-CTERM motif-containing protein